MHAYECKRHAFNTADWTVIPQCCARRLQFNAPSPPPFALPQRYRLQFMHTGGPGEYQARPSQPLVRCMARGGWGRRGRRARLMYFRGGASSSRTTKSPSTSWASPVGQCLSMPSCFGSTAATRPSPSLRLPRSRHPRAQAPLISRASRLESRRPEPQRRPVRFPSLHPPRHRCSTHETPRVRRGPAIAVGAHDTALRRLARPLVAAS